MTADGSAFYQLALWACWFFAYSFVGWVWEVLVSFHQHHRFVNRGFVVGPVLPIYGVGALSAVALLSPIQGVGWQFLAGCAFAAVLEYATSWAMEQLFHARWWDYSDRRFNLNGRICLLGVALFGVMMLAVVYLFQPPLARLTAALPHAALGTCALVLTVAFAADLAASVLRMKDFAHRLDVVQAWLAEIAGSARARAGEAASSVAEVVGDARQAMGEAAGELRQGLGEAAGVTRELASGAVAEGRARVGEAADAGRAAVEAALRRIAPQLPRPSLLERRAMGNPYFKPMRDSEALEWLRRQAGRIARGGHGEDDGDDGRR